MSTLTVEHEQAVFSAVHEYLSENRTFSMVNIVNHLNSRFSKGSININNSGIREILISLLSKKMIVEGSKFTKKDILLNPKRKEIYNFIKENPGLYFHQIVNNFKYSSHIIFWHLKTLKKFNCIDTAIFNSHDVYFKANMDLKKVKKHYLLSKEKSKKIINHLKINDIGVSKTRLATELNMHPNTIKKYLIALEEIKVVYNEKISKQVLYFLNDDYINW